MRRSTRTATTALLAIGLTFAAGATAFAVDEPGPVTPPPSEGLPPTAKGRCGAAIDRRVMDLAKWSAQISLRNNLTADQKSALIGQMTQVSADLINIAKPAVEAATTRALLRAACRSIMTDYRVYLVVHPRVFITAAAQGWLHRIAELEGKAQALASAGKNIGPVMALLAHARGLAEPLPGALAGISPSSYNAEPIGTKTTFNTAKGNLRTVSLDVREAAKLIRKLAKQK